MLLGIGYLDYGIVLFVVFYMTFSVEFKIKGFILLAGL